MNLCFYRIAKYTRRGELAHARPTHLARAYKYTAGMTTLDCEAALSIGLLAKANGSEHPAEMTPSETLYLLVKADTASH